jgi:hypothetical protein
VLSTFRLTFYMNSVVWNIKSQQQRLVQLVPSDTWGGAGLLGVTIRLDNYGGAEDRLIRVLSVQDQSPAAIAGLVGERDFLLGTTHQTFDSTSTLASILRQHEDRVVEVYVYNCDSDKVRVVAIMPTLSWGGQGLLGAEVGVGYLHRLPSEVRDTEGASVERKVRYVGMNAIGSSGHLQQLGSSGTKKQVLLELEPQLEIEAPPDESDDESAEEMNSVGLSSVAGDESPATFPIKSPEPQRTPQSGTERTELPRVVQPIAMMTNPKQSANILAEMEPPSEDKATRSAPTRSNSSLFKPPPAHLQIHLEQTQQHTATASRQGPSASYSSVHNTEYTAQGGLGPPPTHGPIFLSAPYALGGVMPPPPKMSGSTW